MSLPARYDPSLELLTQSEAARLFLARVAAVQPPFTLTDRNGPTVARLCRRLDGIYLALELAAASVPALGIEALAGRLARCFAVLTAGSRAALPRQQTLRATVDWSCALLRPPEQALFARLAVFAGGFTLVAAAAICADGDVPPGEVLGLLVRLVEQSLVLAENDGAGGIRYRLLETVRQYGQERLQETGVAVAVRGCHAI